MNVYNKNESALAFINMLVSEDQCRCGGLLQLVGCLGDFFPLWVRGAGAGPRGSSGLVRTGLVLSRNRLVASADFWEELHINSYEVQFPLCAYVDLHFDLDSDFMVFWFYNSQTNHLKWLKAILKVGLLRCVLMVTYVEMLSKNCP